MRFKKAPLKTASTYALLAVFVLNSLLPLRVWAAESDSASTASQPAADSTATSAAAPAISEPAAIAETANSDTKGSASKSEAATTADAAALTTTEADAQAVSGTAKLGAVMQSSGTVNNSAINQPIIVKPLKLQVNQNNGALVSDYPITVIPGRNGLQPDLKLSYNNQQKDEENIFGYGWSINIPYIERINRKGSDQLYIQNYFNSSLSGELASTSASTYVAKVENGDFLTYTFSNNQWLAKDKAGRQYKFGYTAASRLDNPNDSSKVFRWLLEEVRDTNDNYIKYVYYKDGGQIYPSQIVYTGHGATDGVFTVNFVRSSRPDVIKSYKPAFLVTTNYRITEINTKVNSTLARKYVLAYGSGTNGLKSVLSSVTESGNDDLGITTTLPATAFSYQPKLPGWTYDSSWAVPTAVSSINFSYDKLADVNGDGFIDILATRGDTKTYIGNGHGWTYDASWEVPNYRPGQGVIVLLSNNSSMADINGDGFPDIIYTQGGGTSIYINNGHGWTYDASWTIPSYLTYWDTYYDSLSDINGDGLVDIVSTRNSSTYIYINNGHGWTNNSTWAPPVSLSNNLSSIVDINGDGLPDIVNKSGSSTYIYINNGYGWTQDNSWAIPAFLTSIDFNYEKLVDINGDGLSDILSTRIGMIRIYINNGHGWTVDYSWDMDVSSTSNLNSIVDTNSDGFLDILNIYGGSTKFYINNSRGGDPLVRIANSKGGTTDVTYKSSAQYSRSGTFLNPNLFTTLETVYRLATNDGLTGTSTEQFEYEGGRFYYNSPFDRQFAGFAKVTKTRPDNTLEASYYHQGNGNATSTYEFDDQYAKIGKVYRVDNSDAAGNLYQRTVNKWQASTLSANHYFTYPIQAISQQYDGTANHADSAITYSYDTANGNLLSNSEWGTVSTSDPLNFTDTGTDKRSTAYTYAVSSQTNVNIPSSVTLLDASGNKSKETKYYYDSLPYGQVSLGNNTETDNWISGTTYSSSLKTYNGYGLISSETDPRGKVTGYAYDAYNLYPQTITKPLNMVSSYVYSYPSGQPAQLTDENGQIFKSSYDGLGRLLSEQIPDEQNPGQFLTKRTISYSDTPNIAAHQLTYSHEALLDPDADTYYLYDGLGRSVRTIKLQTSNALYADTDYDASGRVRRQSLPYQQAAFSSTDTGYGASASLSTNYAYDALDRPTTVSDSLGTTTTAYSGNLVTITDPQSKSKSYRRDGLNRLVQVIENNQGNAYQTYYDWDAKDNLLKITDAESNIRNFTYDGLSRRLSAEDLHNPSSQIFGTYAYVYDLAGNLIQVTTPKNDVIIYAYDDLNRQTSERLSADSQARLSYAYDSCTNGQTRLCTVTSDGSANYAYSYAKNGQVASEAVTIPGLAEQTSAYQYDRQGNIKKITLPDSSELSYGYATKNPYNLPISLSRKEAGAGSAVTVVSAVSYNESGQPTSIQYANGRTSTYSYDSAHKYRLSNIVTDAPSGNYQNTSYTWTPVGNLSSLTDTGNAGLARSVTYSYDDLYRLTEANAGASYDQTLSYSPAGSILSKSDQGSYTYSGTNYANPQAVTQIGTSTIAYDGNGNVTSDGTSTYSWNYRNEMLETVAGNATTTDYLYSQNGDRVKYYNPVRTIYYPNKYYEYDASSGKGTVHAYLLDQPIASIETIGTSTTAYYIHRDHLGGTALTTDAVGTIAQALDYYPFGNTRLDLGNHKETKTFTGHTYDPETDLLYMGARYYDAAPGKFLSQDPAARDNPGKFLFDPQQLNFYSYARNNPIVNIDRDGRETVVYVEVGSLSNGIKSIFGHTFIDINGKTYSWAPGEGSAINDSTYGNDLGEVSTDYYLQKEGKSIDSYSTYTFDTTEEQEKKIEEYYKNLAEVNTNNSNDDDVVFDTFSNNCTDIAVDALKQGGVLNNDFNLGKVQTPADLNKRLDQKYKSQSSNSLYQKFKNWWNKSENNQVTKIDKEKPATTNSNNNKQDDKKNP